MRASYHQTPILLENEAVHGYINMSITTPCTNQAFRRLLSFDYFPLYAIMCFGSRLTLPTEKSLVHPVLGFVVGFIVRRSPLQKFTHLSS